MGELLTSGGRRSHGNILSTEPSGAVREQSEAVGAKKTLLSHVWVLVFRRLAAGIHDQRRHVTPFEIPCKNTACGYTACVE